MPLNLQLSGVTGRRFLVTDPIRTPSLGLIRTPEIAEAPVPEVSNPTSLGLKRLDIGADVTPARDTLEPAFSSYKDVPGLAAMVDYAKENPVSTALNFGIGLLGGPAGLAMALGRQAIGTAVGPVARSLRDQLKQSFSGMASEPSTSKEASGSEFEDPNAAGGYGMSMDPDNPQNMSVGEPDFGMSYGEPDFGASGLGGSMGLGGNDSAFGGGGGFSPGGFDDDEGWF